MKRYIKITIIAMLTAIIASSSAMNILAAGSVEMTADKTSCESGEPVSITIKAQSEDGQATPPQLAVEYNPNRLVFENCSVEYGGGGGGLITIADTDATIDFTTISGGEAKVSITAVLNDDGNDVQTAETTITVNGEDVAAGTDNGGTTDTGVEAATITAGDGRVVQTVFADEFMPVLFHKSTTQYQGQMAECAQFDMGDMILLYTTDEAGSDGKFCIFDMATGSLSDFRMIQGIENRFIIILSDEVSEVPYGYTKAVLDWNGQTLTAYMNMEAQSAGVSTFAGLNASDFFLVYGLSSEGNKGWYQYDQSEGTYQRFLQLQGVSGAPSVDGVEEKDGGSKLDGTFLDDLMSRKLQTILLLVFAALTLVLIVVVIILAIKYAEYNDYEYVDPEDYYGNSTANTNNKVTAAMVADNSMNDDREDEEDEEDSSDEEDEESADYFDPRASKAELKARKKQQLREEKEAAKDEKWRLKEEKRLAKMRAKGYEEAQPLDWSKFGDSQDDDQEDVSARRSAPPAYMSSDNDDESEMEEHDNEQNKINDDIEREAYKEEVKEKLPPRRPNPAYSAEREAESAKARKEEEMRLKQKRLFEQQQRIEEQRRIEQEQYEQEQKAAQEKYVLSQRQDEDLDEDFQFEFLNL